MNNWSIEDLQDFKGYTITILLTTNKDYKISSIEDYQSIADSEMSIITTNEQNHVYLFPVSVRSSIGYSIST